MRRRCLACFAAGRTKPPRRGARSRASPSLMRPVATASGWRAGCGRVALGPMSFIQPAFPSLANTGGPKTDRLDTELLKRAVLGWLRGEPDHCSMATIPTLDEEDAKRASRERETLVSERARLVNRIKGTLVRLGIRGFKQSLRHAPERVEVVRTP